MKPRLLCWILLLVMMPSSLDGQTQFEFSGKKKVLKVIDFVGDITVQRGDHPYIEVSITLYEDSKYFGNDFPKSFEYTEKENEIILQGISDDSNREYLITIPFQWNLKFDLEHNHDALTIHQNQKHIEVETQGCDINLIGNSGPISLSTTNGDVFISWKNATPLSDCYITTVSGDIEMEVDQQSSFDFLIRPYQGSVENTIDLKLSDQDKLKRTKAFIGTYNHGGSIINIETTVGDIKLKEK